MRASVMAVALIFAFSGAAVRADDGEPGRHPTPKEDDRSWEKGMASLKQLEKEECYVRSKIDEVKDADVLAVLPACRSFRVTLDFKEGHPKAKGALSTQRHFILRRNDARAYERGNDADMVALARAEKAPFDTQEHVGAFAKFAFAGGAIEKKRDRKWVLTVTGQYSGRPGGYRYRYALKTDAKNFLVEAKRIDEKNVPNDDAKQAEDEGVADAKEKNKRPKAKVNAQVPSKKITVNLTDCPLKEVAEFISEMAGVKINVDPQVEDVKVTLVARDQLIADVFENITAQAGCTYECPDQNTMLMKKKQ